MGAAFQLYIININIDIKYNLYNIISWLTLDAWSLKMWGGCMDRCAAIDGSSATVGLLGRCSCVFFHV